MNEWTYKDTKRNERERERERERGVCVGAYISPRKKKEKNMKKIKKETFIGFKCMSTCFGLFYS